MPVNKVKLREVINNLIDAGYAGHGQSNFVSAAIKYGVYRALGGIKVMAIPPLYKNIVNIVYYMAKIKIKASGRSSINYEKVVKELSKADFVSEMKAITNGDTIEIDILFNNNKNVHICVDRLSDSALTDLTYDIIAAYDDAVTSNKKICAIIKRELQVLSSDWGLN